MDYLPAASWELVGLIIRGIRLLEQKGVEKVYIIGILLLGALAVDSVLISLLNWVWYLICLGLLAIPVDAALRWQSRRNTSLDSASEDLMRSLEGAANHQSARIEAGPGTDKLYITHSEWASEDAFSASAGSGLAKASGAGAPFKRLPFNFCAISLQPFKSPVCAPDGSIFDIDNILPWLLKHGTNPVNGAPLKSTELVKLNFAKNDDGEMVDPVTYKVFTDNTHMVALRNTGNVFAYDTVERLNIKAKMWKDLVNDEEFSRKDIVTLQDPQNVESRNLSSFKYLKDGSNTLTAAQQRERNNPANNVNLDALGSAADVFALRQNPAQIAKSLTKSLKTSAVPKPPTSSSSSTTTPTSTNTSASKPYNAAQHTTGRAAASFTSTGLTPHTTAERALLSDEEYMLKPRRVKKPGYARLRTKLGALTLELLPEHAPKAVWNFIQLSRRGYYTSTCFHRNIRNFMIQGGDPTGTGKGGTSCWGKNFADEFEGPLSHALGRGLVSMANKGKDTNGSQFFVLYRPAKHLDRKHTIFAKVVGGEGGDGMEVLARLEAVQVGEGDRPVEEMRIEGVDVLVDPFEEFLKERREREEVEGARRRAGEKEDERTTWTGKRVRGALSGDKDDAQAAAVGKYLRLANAQDGGASVEAGDEWEEPVMKKAKASGGFGNFDNW
ncbi:MAG: hypothetical protein Q9195_008938 [Heterodermia aff. obscurata]